MALIKCPECGKDVSDTAPSCIHCGFSLSEHFDKQQAQNALQKELDEKLDAIARENVPNKPEGRGTEIFISLLCLAAGIFAFVSMFIIGSMVSVIFFMVGLVFTPLSILMIKTTLNSYKKDMEEYRKMISDWDGYKESEKERTISEYKLYFENIEKYGNRDGKPESAIQKEECTVKCPACGSAKVKKISTAKKVISTELLGLASSDIGKQMVCEKCGYKF